MTTHDFPGRIMKREAQKVIIIVAIERIRVERPTIIFLGKDLRKSSSAERGVRMQRNINNEAEAESRDRASDIIKTIKPFSFKKVGVPESCLLPPGIVIAAVNIMVTIRAATTVQEDVVPFIHFSPSFTNSLWLSVNNSRAV